MNEYIFLKPFQYGKIHVENTFSFEIIPSENIITPLYAEPALEYGQPEGILA